MCHFCLTFINRQIFKNRKIFKKMPNFQNLQKCSKISSALLEVVLSVAIASFPWKPYPKVPAFCAKKSVLANSWPYQNVSKGASFSRKKIGIGKFLALLKCKCKQMCQFFTIDVHVFRHFELVTFFLI